ncbi:uncharacterized protein LOC110444866 [Mizuhopecten yessoensis]|uniref:uncharacterized protein LOC110444866 n=1 Tax=Mizuhopecten yessoensis TaxID=6573 RepID=UPI000B457D65|nr:uncharacterized protein LOC110444866 [Mizuhopecten yessoensis]
MENVIGDISPSHRQKETDIDDISPSNRQKETVIDDITPPPTVIDQVFAPNSKQEYIRETKTPKETVIDDCSNPQYRKETDIDNIFSSIREQEEPAMHDRLPTYNTKETAIDDVSPLSLRRETVSDDSSPSKQSTINETIIDDILSSNRSIASSVEYISPQTVKTQSPVNLTRETDIIPKAEIRNLVVDDVSTSLPITTKCETKHESVIGDPAGSDVINSSTLDDLESAIAPCIEQYTKSVNSPTKLQPEVDHEWSSTEKVEKQEKATDSDASNEYKHIPVVPTFGWVVRTSVVSPSGLKGIKAKISKQQERSRVRKPEQYKSVLTEPVVINPSPPVVRTPDKNPLPVIRQKIMSSRHRFLSADNLTDNVSSQFEHFKMSVSKTPTRQRIYTRRETTPAQKTRRILSFERVDNLSSMHSPRHNSDDSFEKPAFDTLHKDCMFSAHKHKEIQKTTESIDQLHEPLLSYGSVSSLVETDIDSGETFETFFLHETDVDMFGFQHIPLQRTASMSDMMTSRNLEEQKVRKGRFADRNMPKSKSLMALETDIDEEVEGDGSLKRVPSIHEIRVAKSLQKLNVPDWYKRSSVSRSGSTYSLFSERRDSTSTLNSIGYAMSTTSCPCPSISPTSGAVVIKTRVTPSSANRFLRAPKLPVTPEKSPLPPMNFRLPSDRLRKKEKSKELMPIPVVPFSQLRLMFETGKKKTSPVKKSPSTKSEKISPLPSPDVPDHPATSPVTSSAPHPILKVTHADQPPTNGTTTGSRDEESRVKNGRVRISEPEVTNVKPVPPEKPASLTNKEASQEKPTTPTKKGFFSHFKKQKSSSTKSAPVAPPVEPEKLKPSIKPPVPAKPVKSRKEEVNSSSVGK